MSSYLKNQPLKRDNLILIWNANRILKNVLPSKNIYLNGLHPLCKEFFEKEKFLN